MKKLKFILFSMCLLVLSLCLLTNQAYAEEGYCGVYATWHFEDGTLTISGTGTINGHPWSDLPIQSVIIKPGITNVPDFAFAYCKWLSSVSLPDTVTEIGSYAFTDCQSLGYIDLPDSLTRIGDWAFSYSALTSITIPDGVTRIESSTFWSCQRLMYVDFSPNTKFIGEFAFSECESLRNFSLPEGLETIERYAFQGCNALTSVTLPDSLTVIPIGAFGSCSKLSSVTLSPNTVTIGEGAFDGCKKLKSITVPSTVEHFNCLTDSMEEIHISDIGAWCTAEHSVMGSYGLANAKIFLNGELLTDLVVPEGVPYISKSAFMGYQHLQSVTLPKTVTGIGPSAFRNCANLSTITLPDSLESIGGWAFDGCNSLRQVTYNGMQSELSTMEISNGNTPLLNAPWQFGLKGTTDMLLQLQTVSSGIALLAQVVVVIVCSVILYRQKKYPYL